MRRKIALSVLGLAVAATVAPLQSAAAICWDTYYELTGTCTPCHTAGYAVRVAEGRLNKELADVHCFQ